MYKYLIFPPQSIKVKSFQNLSSEEKTMCAKFSSSHNFTANDYVIVSLMPKCVLGYICLKENTILNSSYWKIFQNNNKQLYGEGADILVSLKSYQITEWEFDEILRNEQLLNNVFSTIILFIGEQNLTILLWCDINNDLIYYPIKNEAYKFKSLSATKYFVDSFIKSK